MSAEYRQRFVDKISQEATEFLASTSWANPEVARRSALAFIRRRIRHYGLQNKYLPPDFKKIEQQQNGSIADGIAGTTDPAV